MNKTLSVCTLVVLSASLAAQASTTIPTGFDKTEGQSAMAIPLMYAPSRAQCGYGPTAVTWKTAKLIKELWVRADKSAYLTTAFADTSLQVKLSSKGCCDPNSQVQRPCSKPRYRRQDLHDQEGLQVRYLSRVRDLSQAVDDPTQG